MFRFSQWRWLTSDRCARLDSKSTKLATVLVARYVTSPTDPHSGGANGDLPVAAPVLTMPQLDSESATVMGVRHG